MGTKGKRGEIIGWEGLPYTKKIGALYNEYYGTIYNMVYLRVGRNKEVAEEVTQDVWVAVIGSLRKFKGNSSIYTWICGIVQHKITDYYRRDYMKRSTLNHTSLEQDCFHDPEDNNPLPDELAEKAYTSEIVRGALKEIPEHYQQVLTLKYIEELSANEIARNLGKTTKSVNSLIERAKNALRQELAICSL